MLQIDLRDESGGVVFVKFAYYILRGAIPDTLYIGDETKYILRYMLASTRFQVGLRRQHRFCFKYMEIPTKQTRENISRFSGRLGNAIHD